MPATPKEMLLLLLAIAAALVPRIAFAAPNPRDTRGPSSVVTTVPAVPAESPYAGAPGAAQMVPDTATPPLRFERISIEQGLLFSVVHSVLQDRQGFLWIGTQDGLNRFDGYG